MNIEAMKQALEALERIDLWLKARYSGIGLVGVELEAITSLRQAIAKAEKQEPVGEAYLCDRCHTPFNDAWECPSCGHNMAVMEPVYRAPPQRQPLTDEQKDALIPNHSSGDFSYDEVIEIIQKVEAAHGIKGEA